MIRLHQNLFLWLSPTDSHQQRLQHDIRCLKALHRPANDAAGIEIDDDGQIGKTFIGSDVGSGLSHDEKLANGFTFNQEVMLCWPDRLARTASSKARRSLRKSAGDRCMTAYYLKQGRTCSTE